MCLYETESSCHFFQGFIFGTLKMCFFSILEFLINDYLADLQHKIKNF